MSKITLRKWLIAAALLLPCAANAAGLGKLTVLSVLGQPLEAEIDLVSVQKEEASSLSVRLAPPEAYRQANLQYGPALVGLRISIEKRPNGQPFVKVTSSRAVNEPFIDLLLELNWASGRLVREFTALIDPPGLTPAAPVAAAPMAAPEARPAAPVPAAPAPARAAAPAGSYGPIQRGDTLSKIARNVKPEGVTLEQMLVGLFRSNPDAFINKNMNLVRSGKILRVPDKDEVSAIPQREAVKEYRAQVADWKNYRAQLADAPAAAREGGTAASGRITTRIEDKGAAEARDVVRLSKGEAPGQGAGGGGRSAVERIKSLEEEVVAREKALKEANDRVAQLEKTIQDMQRLAEIKSQGLAAAQQQAQTKGEPKPAAPAPEPPKPEAKAPPQPEPASAKPEAPQPPKPEADKAAPKAEADKAGDKQPPKPKPVAKAPPPPPPPEPSVLDMLLDPMVLGGGGVVVLGGLGYWLMRRRRAQAVAEEQTMPAPKPTMPDATATIVQAPAAAGAPAAELDPLDEATVYVTHGRDAQAEAVLTEAIAKDPDRETLHVKLLEVYALRGDKAAFAKHAEEFRKRTGGTGDNWARAAAMGFGIDPENPMYAVSGAAPAVAAAGTEPAGVDLDFNLDLPADTVAAAAPPAASATTDFEIEVPAVEPAPAAPAAAGSTIDFDIQLPTSDAGSAPAPAAPAAEASAALDFKIDLSALDLSLDDKKAAAAAPETTHDPHWHDVQAKFDLAKAYQEMGDKAGATEILKEVLREGDSEQQAQAKALLDSLG